MAKTGYQADQGGRHYLTGSLKVNLTKDEKQWLGATVRRSDGFVGQVWVWVSRSGSARQGPCGSSPKVQRSRSTCPRLSLSEMLTRSPACRRVVDMNTACETETCSTCRADVVDVNEAGECRPCATFAHNLRLMAAGVSRGKDGRYTKVGKK